MRLQDFNKKYTLLRKTDRETAKVYSLVLDEAQKAAKGDRRDLSDDDLVTGAKRSLKKARQSAEAGMDVSSEIAIYESFIPKSVDQEEVNSFISKNSIAPYNIGVIMKSVRENFGNNVDMKATSSFIKSL